MARHKPTTPRTGRAIAPPLVQGGPAARAIRELSDAANVIATEPSIPGKGSTGDLYYRDADGAVVRLPIGTAGQVLTVVDGLPTWS